MRTDPPTALTIAGSDSGGGAGLQADLKTFLDHGVFGMTAITAITAQNTRGVTRVDLVPVEGLRAQLAAVFDDLPVSVVKIGMLATAAHAAAVVEALLARRDRPPIVLDPVMVATTGARLLDADAVAVIREGLLPLATVATPNLPEAAVLAGDDTPDALVAWAAGAPCAVLLTGGDAGGETVTDRLVVGARSVSGRHEAARVRDWTGPRVPIGDVHGTGCTLSSAIAARLARGAELDDAIDGAIRYTRALVALAADLQLGGGARSVGGRHKGARVLPHGALGRQ